ncbi:MAG: T9SS C-terminal target domain-containing protein [Bacteroidetes bacterium]|nr:MAG: T9SS C-terminal target domain-containing protein [Bacteroidota bacterium]
MARLFTIALLALAVFAARDFSRTATRHPLKAHADIVNPKKTKSVENRAEAVEERLRFDFDMLKDPATGEIPEGIRQLELAQAYRAPLMETNTRNAFVSVRSRGPVNLGGRTRAMAFDVRYNGTTNKIILAGGVSGGVFRSDNGGLSWTKVSSQNEIHNVTALAQDPRPGFQDIWYYATGEQSGNSASLGTPYHGQGIWKSTDNGLTWTLLGNSNTGALESFDNCVDFCSKLVVNPANGHVYAAVSGEIIRSTNQGSSWSSVLGPTCFTNGGTTDIVCSSSGQLYAAFAGIHAAADDGVWTSASGGAGTWTRIANSGAVAGWNASGGYGRCVLALAPSNQNKLFALYDNGFVSSCTGVEGIEADLFVYDATTGIWTDLSTNLPNEAGCLDGNDPFAVQGGYDLVVAVKPDDENTVFVGGTNLYRSTTGFTTAGATTRIGGYVSSASYANYTNHHADIHCLVFEPGNPSVMCSGTDGGIHRADITAATPSWTSLNNKYLTYQYYHVAIDPATGSNYVIGGLQDNGTKQSASGSYHSGLGSGDGVAVGIATPYLRYYGSQRGSIVREGTNIKPTGSGSGIFVTYFYLDPDNTSILYYASNDALYRTINAPAVTTATWTNMTGIATALTSNIRAMAATRSSGYNASNAARKLYIGTSGGQLYRLNDPAYAAAATAPVNITPGTAGAGVVSGISVNPNDDREILVTYSNYGINSVYHTTNADNAAPTWTNVEGNISLPSFRSCAIMIDGGTTYYVVGTSVGMYCTTTLNGAATVWNRIGAQNLGYAVVSSMALRPADNTLLAGTHGNGMFMVSPPRAPEIQFAAASSSSLEGGPLTEPGCRRYRDYDIPVTISGVPVGAATLTITPAGSAAEGRDYDILNPGKQLIFPDGSGETQNLLLRVYDDSQNELNETITFTYTLSGATNAVAAGVNQSHTHTLKSDDPDPATSVLVYKEDFEGDLVLGGLGGSNWAAGSFSGTSGQWIIGSQGSLSGNKCAYFSRNGDVFAYNPLSTRDVVLQSAPINATGLSGLTLSFDFKAEGENAADYGRLVYSLNGVNYFTIEGSTTTPYVNQAVATTRSVALPALLDNTTFYLGWRWIHNNNGVGATPFAIDNVVVTSSTRAVETQLNATDEEYLGPFQTAAFYEGGELIAVIENTSAHNYGCTSVTVNRAGTGVAEFWNATGDANDLAAKTVLVTPEFNNPAGSYNVTLYYSQAEVNGWQTATGKTWATDAKMVKSPGAIANVTPANPYPDGSIDVVNGTKGAFATTDSYIQASFTNGFSGFGVGDPGAAPPTLPVEWLSVRAKAEKQQVIVEWQTAEELNNDYYEVERMGSAGSFEAIGQVASRGNSVSPQGYRFYDRQPMAGRNVYRIRQVDSDGRFSYSSSVEAFADGIALFSVAPSPFGSQLGLRYAGQAAQQATFRLYTYEGRQVLSHEWTASPGSSEMLDTEHLAPGIYLYELRSGGQVQKGKLVKR